MVDDEAGLFHEERYERGISSFVINQQNPHIRSVSPCRHIPSAGMVVLS